MNFKKIIYVSAFTFLGFLLQFLLHALIEICYIRLLAGDLERYGFGFSWQQWYSFHYIASVIFVAGGLIFGFFMGRYWWRQIYVLKRYGKVK